MSLVSVHDIYHLRATNQLCSSLSVYFNRMVATYTLSKTQLLPRLDDIRTGLPLAMIENTFLMIRKFCSASLSGGLVERLRGPDLRRPQISVRSWST